MKTEVKMPILIAIVAAVAGLAIFFGYTSISRVGSLDHGQVKYTAGKPPWLESDPSKRGPGGAPGVPGTSGVQAANQAPTAPGMPVGPPVIGNGK